MARMKSCVRAALGGVLIGAAALCSAGSPADATGHPLMLAAAGGADYDMGYRDGYDNKPYRDKDRSNRAYGDGYKAGQEQRKSGGGAPAGSDDFQLGWRDGYGNQTYRDKDRSNKAYGDGYKAGQERRRGGGSSLPGNADFQLGYRDGYDRQPYRDKDRSNKSYGEGFKAGQTDRERGVSPTQRPGMAGASGRPRSLVGRNADDLENDMKAIGYTWRSGTMKGRDSHTTWRGATDSQCVLAVSRNGKVASVSDVSPSNCR
jgi:hypothetical protein